MASNGCSESTEIIKTDCEVLRLRTAELQLRQEAPMDVNITGYCEDSLTSRSTVEQCFILTFYGLSELSRKK